MVIVPDIHGRSFWRSIERRSLNEEVVFLGDYVDPYPNDNIQQNSIIKGFSDIIRLKITNPDRVTLLLGNHDLHYLDADVGRWRYDERLAPTIKSMIINNLNIFDIVHSTKIGRTKYIISHAGFLNGWIETHYQDFRDKDIFAIGEELNKELHDKERISHLMKILSEASRYRSGSHPFGSPIWADLREHLSNDTSFAYQIFGHSLRPKETITPSFACLDCACCFQIMPENIICRID